MPLVILEGPDGSGKSTVAQRLLKGTGQPTLLLKRSGPPGAIETIRFMSFWIRDQSEQGLNILCDRHPVISEAIYAPVVRKVPWADGPQWTMQEAAAGMKGKDLLLVYCRTWIESLKASAKVEDQMAGVHQYYDELVAEYDRWFDYFENCKLPIHRHDYRKDPNCTHAINVVKDFWEKKR